MKKSIFLVKTPLQLLNAIEAKYYYNLNIDDCVLIVMGDRKNLPQLLKLADAVDEWGKVLVLNNVNLFFGSPFKESNSFLSKLIIKSKIFNKSIYNVRRLNNVSHYLGEVKYIFLGYPRYVYMKHFANITPHEKIIALDDGNVTIELANERNKSLVIANNQSIKQKLKMHGKKMIQRVSDKDLSELTFFTIYDISPGEHDNVEENKFTHLRSNVDLLPVSNEVYFLGGPVSEVGIISQESYLSYLKKVKAYFSSMEIVYIAHRRELPVNLDRIKNELGFKVVLFEYPIEYQLAYIGPVPKVLASFFSSALDSCRVIFSDRLKIKSFMLDLTGSPMQAQIEPIYDNFQSNEDDNFKVITDY